MNDLDASVARYAALLGARPGRSGNEATIVVGGTTLRLVETPGAREGARSITIARSPGDALRFDGVAVGPGRT